MKLIDNDKYYGVQSAWFIKQINAGDSGVWIDWQGAKMSLQGYQSNFDNIFFGGELRELREFLSATGLKRLNNAISAHIKRAKKDGLKTVQLQLPVEIADKFLAMSADHQLTMSDMLVMLVRGEIQLGLDLGEPVEGRDFEEMPD